MSETAPYRVPHEPGRWRAIALAAVVHGALVALLWFGVSWQSETPVAVEAEVWSPQAREAAPRAAAPPPPLPEPEVARRVPAPQPVREAPVLPKLETPQPKAPDIALEQERKRKAEQREREQENAERLKAEELRKQKMQQLAEQKDLQKRLAREAELKTAQKAEEKAEQKRSAQAAEAAERKKLEAEKKLALEKQRKQDAASEQKLEAMRAENLRRLTDSASTSTTSSNSNVGSGGSGDAARSQGSRADPSYTQKVGAKIRSNTIFNGADELTSNPSVEFAVELLPDGSIRRLRKTKSSGVPGFDEAVSRAIEKSQPFPPDKSGTAPSGFTVAHKPKDQ